MAWKRAGCGHGAAVAGTTSLTVTQLRQPNHPQAREGTMPFLLKNQAPLRRTIEGALADAFPP